MVASVVDISLVAVVEAAVVVLLVVVVVEVVVVDVVVVMVDGGVVIIMGLDVVDAGCLNTLYREYDFFNHRLLLCLKRNW